MKKNIVLMAFLLTLGMLNNTWAEVFNVNDTNEIQDALTTAESNGEEDTINIEGGDYYLSYPLIYEGNENFALTIIGAGIGSTNLNGGSSNQIMNIQTTAAVMDTNALITIQSITFRNGHADNEGGGLFINTRDAGVTLEKSEFVDNDAGSYGGVYIRTNTGTIALNDNVFTNNEVLKLFGAAGVLADSNASITLTNNIFCDNASVGGLGGGARVYTPLGTITLTNNIFQNNSSVGFFGGAHLFTPFGAITLTNNTFDGNTATSYGGPFILTTDGTITLDNNTISGNAALTWAGLYISAGDGTGTITLNNNTIRDNIATNGYGGGLYIQTGSGVIVLNSNIIAGNEALNDYGGAYCFADSGAIRFFNNILSGNSAFEVGGAYIGTISGTLNITNNTAYKNTASNDIGGLYIDLDVDTLNVDIYNNIIWDNLSSSVHDLYIWDNLGTVKLYNNDIRDFVIEDGTNLQAGVNISEDPLLTDDFHLQTNSPCIDIGDNNAPQSPLIDFEGNERIVDGDLDGMAIVDLGADEYAERDISVYPLSVDFQEVYKGECSSSAETITLVNDGSAGLTISTTVITGANVDDFRVNLDGGPEPIGRIPALIPVNGSRTFNVTFCPSSTGEKCALLEIISDDPDEGAVTIPLIGTGTNSAQDILVKPLRIDFGNINKGDSSSDEIITIENEGGAHLSVSNIVITGNDADDFTIDLEGGPNPVQSTPATILPGEDATITVVFSPSSAGAKSASLEITSNDPDEETTIIILTGSGRGGCFLSSFRRQG